MGKGLLHRREVLKDVRVIELEVVHDGNLGQVMDELAALVKERGVVLITLDDEPFAVREARTLPEIRRDTADQKARIATVVLKHPSQQRSSRGLAVRAADDETTFA